MATEIPAGAFALLALLLASAAELLLRQAHAKPVGEAGYLVVQTGTVFTSMTLVSMGHLGFALTPAMAGLGVLSGVLGYATGRSFMYAIGRGPAGVTSAVRRGSFVVTALLAVVFLDEQLSALRIAAMLLVVCAFAMMASDSPQAGRPHPMLAITVLTAGGMAFCHKLGAIAGVSISAFLMCQSGTAHVTSHLLCLRGGYGLTRRTMVFGATTGALYAASMLCVLSALRTADAVIIVPLLQLGFLVTAPASFLLFREPATPRKLFALALGAVAIVLFGLQLS